MTNLERASREVVNAAKAGDLDRLAAALEARQTAMQRASLEAGDPSGKQKPHSSSFALGEHALAQLREVADSIREQQARLDAIQAGFALDVAVEPRLDFRG